MATELFLRWAYLKSLDPRKQDKTGSVTVDRPVVIALEGIEPGKTAILQGTSHPNSNVHFVELHDWESYGLSKPTYIYTNRTYLVDKSDLHGKPHLLSQEDTNAILEEMSSLMPIVDLNDEAKKVGTKGEMLEPLEGSDDLQGIVKFLIEDENEAVDGYDKAIKAFNAATLPTPDREHIVSELQHIKEEELEHIRELEEVLKYVPDSYVPSEQAETAAAAEDEASKEEAEGEEPSAPTHEGMVEAHERGNDHGRE